MDNTDPEDLTIESYNRVPYLYFDDESDLMSLTKVKFVPVPCEEDDDFSW